MFPSNSALLGIVQTFLPDRIYKARPLFENDVTDGEEYKFDQITHNKGIAGFRNSEADANLVKTLGKERISADLFTLKDKKRLSKRLLRLENTAGKLNGERLKELLVREMEDLADIHDRTWEKHMWDLITTGILTVVEDGVTKTFDFGLGNASTAGNLWNVAADATPLSDLQACNKALRRTWGAPGTKVFMSSDALRMAMQCADTTERLDRSTLDTYHRDGIIDKLSTLNIDIVDTGYTPDGGSFTPYLSDDGTNANMAIIVADGFLGKFVEGEPVDGDAPDGHIGRFVKIFKDNSDSKVPHFLQEHFAVPGLTMPNKIYALKVF